MINRRRLILSFAVLASAACLSGCGAVLVTKTVAGAGSLAVGGAVGAVRLTGRTAGAVVGLAQEQDEQIE